MQSPNSAIAVAALEPLPIQISFAVSAGKEPVESVAHVPLPARKVVAEGVPVIAVMLLVPMPVRPEPEPLKVVPATVPVMLAPPAETVSPPAVTVNPPLLTVGPVMVGEVNAGDAASTTLPLPV